MFFDELNDDEWALLSALVSDEPAVRLNRRGRPRAEPRIVTNAVLWILTTGEPWSKLPGRYPSGPTCRRRFEEWQLNGTLAEVVQLLSQTGRRFAYIPEPSSVPVAPQRAAHPAHQPVTTPSACDDEGVRGVFWKSPESWQAPHEGAQDSRPVDPFAEITRQLSGSPDDAPTRANGTDAVADHAAAHQDDGSRAAMWLGLSEQGTQFADRRGYGIYVMAQPVPGEMYRAWAEIMKDGKRVERSGLVGPRFETPEAAEQYALEWAQQWIDRDESTLAAAAQADTLHAGALRPVSRPMPAPRPAATSASGPVVAAAAPAPAPSAAKAITQPVTVTSANMHAAAQANVNAHRIPLRRYPESTRESSTEDSTTGRDRFAPAAEFISHAG
ncbi:transposase [Paraburkholderia sartisoli]|uniref:Putative transposase of IS4/5 family n=1 Tax=Paraburkholderia sartisoli TaxID=83784 RepID=A0A1H4E051_9BURK|nr:Putative transposase of IS4/5 family [Paraburkholderia sartisoli]